MPRLPIAIRHTNKRKRVTGRLLFAVTSKMTTVKSSNILMGLLWIPWEWKWRSGGSGYTGYYKTGLNSVVAQVVLGKCNKQISIFSLRQDIGAAASVLGPNGVMYLEGHVVSGPLDSLVKLLLPLSTTTIPPTRLADELDEVRLFKQKSFLLGLVLMIEEC